VTNPSQNTNNPQITADYLSKTLPSSFFTILVPLVDDTGKSPFQPFHQQQDLPCASTTTSG
jgi:hypothetical protein